MKYDYIFWDWNGTLLDDFDANLYALNVSLKKYGLPIMERSRYARAFRFPVVDFYVDLGFKKEDYADLADGFTLSYASYEKIGLYSEVKPLLEELKELGLRQVILSASNRDILLRQLNKENIAGYFEEILGLSDVLAFSKLALGENWRRFHPSARVLMIGDSEHDFEVAEALDFDCALIEREHNCKDLLKKCGAPVLNSLNEILTLLY